jgi:hypothetical protein
VGYFTFVIEGKGLGSALAEMDRSDGIRVLGPHISTYYPGSGANGERMVIAVEADTAEAGEDRLWGYLEPESAFAISADLRGSLEAAR